ncbi:MULTISPECIES: hypothetical protein [unclassified Halomonas]|uniref:hypothetical protein n=1 Tax=unclassified Halomonas TaxID=2609666 RepID=UPI00209FEED6|nr:MULTISPECIES: hypothetical protein [unclassified Halomonas]MCP1313405.1 hypothetical protein [Halomonas sp. 707D7]MCP1325512.1 hypothetical protein [Halomonas sp. 707D4]
MFYFLRKQSFYILVILFFTLVVIVLRANALKSIGTVKVTVDGNTQVYNVVAVEVEGNSFRSSNYIESNSFLSKSSGGKSYSISITGYEKPSLSDDLKKLIPIEADRSISVFAFINSEGKEIRNAAITWEADPEKNFYWASDNTDERVTLDIESYNIDPTHGEFVATFSGTVCSTSLPDIERDYDNCKEVSVYVDSELTKNY